MDKLMYKIAAVMTLIAAVCYCSAPATFEKKQYFYTEDFETTKGMKVIEVGMKIGIVDDEVYIGRPRIWIDHDIALCHCKAPATHLSFKAGKPETLCQKHTKFIHPKNQQAYPTQQQAIHAANKKDK